MGRWPTEALYYVVGSKLRDCVATFFTSMEAIATTADRTYDSLATRLKQQYGTKLTEAATLNMFRLLYRGLATRSRFWFLQGTDPNSICCEAPRCNGVERSVALDGDRLSLSDTSELGLSPPGTPPARPSVNVPTGRFELSGSKSKKHRFFDEDQSAVTPAPKQVCTSKNLYAVLAEVEGSYGPIVHSAEGTDDEMSGASAFQIFPQLGRVPESVRANKTRTKRLTNVIAREGAKSRCGRRLGPDGRVLCGVGTRRRTSHTTDTNHGQPPVAPTSGSSHALL